MRDTIADVLLVEDNPGDVCLLEEMLRDSQSDPMRIVHAECLADALGYLKKQSASIIFLDLGLPDALGSDIVTQIRAVVREVPVIVLTGLDDEIAAVEALEAGAQDYLIKGRVTADMLLRSMRYAALRQKMQAEADYLHRRELELKDELVSHVSHELRSPLTSIYQFVEILRDGLPGPLNEEQRGYLELALDSARQLRGIIDDLLNVSKIQAGKLTVQPRRVEAAAVIAEAVEAVAVEAGEKNLTLSLALPTTLPPVLADPLRLGQALASLLSNALKFTPSGGTIRVGAGVAKEEPDVLRVWVKDTGRGMTVDQARLVFDRLYQVPGASAASRKGLGLGLYIAKELVERQGGKIWAISEPGRGSTFAFTLPIFSLSRFLGPLLASRAAPLTIAFVEVSMAACVGPDCAAAWEELAREAQRVVQSCLAPGAGVLLPALGAAPRPGTLFIVAVADEASAPALAHQLRERLEGEPHLRLFGLRANVTVELFALEAERSKAEVVAEVVGKVERKIETILHGGATHGEEENPDRG